VAKSIKKTITEKAHKLAKMYGASKKNSHELAKFEIDYADEIAELKAEMEDIKAEFAIDTPEDDVVEEESPPPREDPGWKRVTDSHGNSFRIRDHVDRAKPAASTPGFASQHVTRTGRAPKSVHRTQQSRYVRPSGGGFATKTYDPKPMGSGFARTNAVYTCDLCGYRSSYRKESGLPKTCINCKKPTDTPANIIPTPAVEGKIASYVQLRVVCKSCWSKATVWAKKKSGGYSFERKCLNPECGATGPSVTVSRIDLRGAVDESLWSGNHPRNPKKVKKDKHVCGNCGHRTFYLTRPPEVCPSCGHKE